LQPFLRRLERQHGQKYQAIVADSGYKSAKTNLIGRLNGCGVPFTADEADTLIMAAYQTTKSAFNVQVSKEAAV